MLVGAAWTPAQQKVLHSLSLSALGPLPADPSNRYADEGRATITKRPGDRGAFKTPTLRDVARHPPYMHDGSLQTLRDVILFYERGGVRNPYLDTQIRPFDVSPRDVDALVDFLETLNGEGFMDRAPTVFPR